MENRGDQVEFNSSSEMDIGRRDFLVGFGGLAAGAWLTAHAPELHAIARYAAEATPETPWEFFTPEEARDFDAISAQIIPSDETPGAREAHVVRFVDRYLATVFKVAAQPFHHDFTKLGDAVAKKSGGNRSFAAMSDADQIALLKSYEVSDPVSFSHFRGSTMVGMFSDPIHGGNFHKIGWKLVGFEDGHSWTPPFGHYDRV